MERENIGKTEKSACEKVTRGKEQSETNMIFLKRNEGISSIVYLLYLKQIYLHIFMQHSFITIYSLDSISCGRGGSMFFDH